MNNRYCRMAMLLHAVIGALGLGVWFLIDGPIWAGAFWLVIAAYYTPQLARERGHIFVLRT